MVSAAVSPTGAFRQASESLIVESELGGSASPVLVLHPSPAGAGRNSNFRSKRDRSASSTRSDTEDISGPIPSPSMVAIV